MGINNWWAADPAEGYWMEIRDDPTGLGEYLRAPQAGGTGKPQWSYDLTTYVQPGDRVLHWSKTSAGGPSIVGWSEAVGPLETITWSWQARGSRGRERGVPTTGPTWSMPLTNYSELEHPVTRSDLNARRARVLKLLEDGRRVHGGSMYPPFYNYGGRELRATQAYLVKFPAALVAMLFKDEPVAAPEATSGRRQTVRQGQGQGYLSDAAKRMALERHAVRMAIDHYRAIGATEIEELGKPYDLRVTLDAVERHVEVKGSMGGELSSVQLTQGEVDHARNYQPTDLFVVDGISASTDADGVVATSGGVTRVWPDWVPNPRALRPTHLRYTLPPVSR